MKLLPPLPRGATLAPLALVVALAGCASFPAPRCGVGEQRLVSDLLYFGTEMPGAVVTQAQWSDFLGTVVTPKFPEGLSVWPASGQWRSATGAVTREASHVLNLVHPETEAADSAVRAIVTAYKSQFQQEAVLRVRGSACVSF
jgi:Protein of unknown function (DUF3574)